MREIPKNLFVSKGDVFILQSIFNTKVEARKKAELYQNKGHLVRVLPFKDKFVLYTTDAIRKVKKSKDWMMNQSTIDYFFENNEMINDG